LSSFVYFAFNKCSFQGNGLQPLAKYIRFSMFEEAQLSGEKSQNREVSFGQKEMRMIKGSWLSPIQFFLIWLHH